MPSFSATPEAEGVDERVAVVGRVEGGLAAHRRDADAVAVAPDPGDDPADEVPGLRQRRVAEAEGVQQHDRPGAHGEDVAQDPPDAGGRALVGLDERRVVVALDLEDDGQAVADVDDPGVLAGALTRTGCPSVGRVFRWMREDL